MPPRPNPPRVPPNTPAPPPPPPPPRLSSSLLLLDHENRILLVQRSSAKSMSFSSAIVFPGGNLDPAHDTFLLPEEAQSKFKTMPTSFSPDGMSKQLDLSPELITALKTCAIRETFEETGVLLAESTTKSPPSPETLATTRSSLLNQHKNPTTSSTTTFSHHLTSLNLSLPLSSLHPFTTWITPPNLPRRYHTTMFLSFLSPNLPFSTPSTSTSTPTAHGLEILQTRWIHPKDILASYHSQSQPNNSNSSNKTKLILFPPQLYLLTRLASILPNREKLLELSQGDFGRYVVQPYTKRVLEGEEKGKVLLGVDRPRGDDGVWIKARFGREGPGEVELLEREKAREGKGGARI